MDDNLSKVKKILIKYEQEHLLQFYEELDDIQKEHLLNQIMLIDFDEILSLYEDSKTDDLVDFSDISPLPHIDKEKLTTHQIEYYSKIGTYSIRKGELAVLTLAGGQGSRLGCKGPKGTFELDIIPKKSLFEILCDNLKLANSEYNITIPWYLMTSEENHEQTIQYFENKNYFDYGKENIVFFKQNSLPLIDITGKLILSDIYNIKEASNGNGAVFEAMKKHNIIQDMKKKNVKWITVGGIDNVLFKTADPIFLGTTISANLEIASKTIFKEDIHSKLWVFARKKGRPTIVDYNNFTDEMYELKDYHGNYLYRETNILAHLFSINAIEKLSTSNLPYHRAFRKNAFINYEGMKQVPESSNTFKFEKFVFDAFEHFDNIQLLRVKREDEFAPIKDFTGPDNPEIAKELYEKNKF